MHYDDLDAFVHYNFLLKVPQSEIRRVFDTYGAAENDPDLLPLSSLEEFFGDWMFGDFVFEEVPYLKFSRRYRQVLAYKGLSIGNQDGDPSVQEMYEDLRDRFPEEDFDWMLDNYYSECSAYYDEDYFGSDCPFDQPDFFVDNWILRDFSTDREGLTSDELHTFVEQGLFEKDADKAVSYISDHYSSTPDDYMTREDLIRFF